MKTLSVALVVLGLCAAGCESSSDIAETVRTRVLAPREEPRSRSFKAPQRAVYEAALRAAKDMDFRYVRGGPAEGVLEELNRVETTGPAEETAGSSQSSRQVSLHAKMEPTVDGGTLVTVAFGEILEADSTLQAGVATETPMRDTPMYEVFFRGIQEQLDAPSKH